MTTNGTTNGKLHHPPEGGISEHLQEALNAGGDDSLRAVAHKVKNTFRGAFRHALVESSLDIYGLFGASFIDPLDFSSDMGNSWNAYPFTSPAYFLQNQKRGEVLPAYLYEQQLRIYRDRSRKLCQENEYAICATENRQNYAVGAEGFQFKAVPAKPEAAKGLSKLVARVQWVIDHWIEHNDMAEYAKDVMMRLDRDGEAFTRYFPQPSGLVSIRTVEAEHVRSPNADYGPHYSFGIQCDPEDVETREGYWVVEDPLTKGWIPSFVPAEEICHIKINTPRSAKRGLPTFYPCEQLLRIASDLLVGVAKNANHRAKIAMVRTVTGALQEAAQSMLDKLKDVNVMDPNTGKNISVEKYQWSSILTVPDTVKLDFPNANFDSANFDTALQMVLRAVAARLVMPEWMLSINAQNSNFSSSMIAEAPSTKAFEAIQEMLLRRIGANRTRSRESMVWFQVRHAVKVGLLPPETLTLVKIECKGPSLIVRDKSGEAQQNSLYYGMRAKSKRIIQMENNWDPEQVQRDFEEDDAEKMQLQAEQAEQQIRIQQAEVLANAKLEAMVGQPQQAKGGGGEQEQAPNPGRSDASKRGAERRRQESGNEGLQAQMFDESGSNGRPPAGRIPAREGVIREALEWENSKLFTGEGTSHDEVAEAGGGNRYHIKALSSIPGQVARIPKTLYYTNREMGESEKLGSDVDVDVLKALANRHNDDGDDDAPSDTTTPKPPGQKRSPSLDFKMVEGKLSEAGHTKDQLEWGPHPSHSSGHSLQDKSRTFEIIDFKHRKPRWNLFWGSESIHDGDDLDKVKAHAQGMVDRGEVDPPSVHLPVTPEDIASKDEGTYPDAYKPEEKPYTPMMQDEELSTDVTPPNTKWKIHPAEWHELNTDGTNVETHHRYIHPHYPQDPYNLVRFHGEKKYTLSGPGIQRIAFDDPNKAKEHLSGVLGKRDFDYDPTKVPPESRYGEDDPPHVRGGWPEEGRWHDVPEDILEAVLGEAGAVLTPIPEPTPEPITPAMLRERAKAKENPVLDVDAELDRLIQEARDGK